MTVSAYVIGDTSTRLWGLSSHERIERQLRAARVNQRQHQAGQDWPSDAVLLINAAYLFETRTLQELLQHPASVLQSPTDGRIAAAYLPSDQADEGQRLMATASTELPEDIEILTPAMLDSFDGDLRRSEPPLLEPVGEHNRRALENRLYGNAYKGITDLVTKWLWPRPAKHLVRACADAGITPNMVTLLGLALVIIASVLFAYGYFAGGLLCGWIMTLLDTVDGKLARVTVQSSRLGHVLDHGLDIVHPPFWYVLWGVGLTAFEPQFGLDHVDLYWLIGLGYIAGRLIEGAFHALGRCSMFAWRPFDAYFRLITARRNPCLIILTIGVACGRADLAFAGVAYWTVLSSAIMALRLIFAAWVRWRRGPLNSWLEDPASAQALHGAAYRTFSGTRAAYA